MKLKEMKKLGILYIIVGVVLFLIGIVTDGAQGDNWFVMIGSALAAVGILRILKISRLNRNPEQAADYDASLQDERVAYVANKARSLTFFISVYAQLIIAFVLVLVFRQTLIGEAFCMLTGLQCVIYTLCFWHYSKRY